MLYLVRISITEVFNIKKYDLSNKGISIVRKTRLVLLLGVILIIAGCSSSAESKSPDKNITTIQTVLEHQFTGPNKEFIEGIDNIPKLEQYYEKRYKSYFTEDMYSKFIAAHAYDYLLTAYNHNKQIKVKNVSVESIDSTEGGYNFKVVVLYDKAGRNQGSAELSGTVNFNEDGKIANIKYLNDGGLSEELRN
jgi:hypothetical protein